MIDNGASEFARRTQYEATIKTLSEGSRAENILTLVDNALALTARLLDSIEQKSKSLACEMGCHFCCYLMATVSAPEALAIVHRLKERCGTEELKELKERLTGAYRQTRKMNNMARIRAGIPCPMLTKEGLCEIYEYRPLDCMTYHSLSRQACQEMLEEPERGHPSSVERRALGMGLKAGLGQGLVAVKLEQPALRYELIEALYLCLNDDKAMDNYLAGKNILKPAAIIIDPDRGISHKIKYAPGHLKAQAKRVIALERRQARRAKKKGQKGKRSV